MKKFIFLILVTSSLLDGFSCNMGLTQNEWATKSIAGDTSILLPEIARIPLFVLVIVGSIASHVFLLYGFYSNRVGTTPAKRWGIRIYWGISLILAVILLMFNGISGVVALIISFIVLYFGRGVLLRFRPIIDAFHKEMYQ